MHRMRIPNSSTTGETRVGLCLCGKTAVRDYPPSIFLCEPDTTRYYIWRRPRWRSPLAVWSLTLRRESNPSPDGIVAVQTTQDSLGLKLKVPSLNPSSATRLFAPPFTTDAESEKFPRDALRCIKESTMR